MEGTVATSSERAPHARGDKAFGSNDRNILLNESTIVGFENGYWRPEIDGLHVGNLKRPVLR